jgi:uncharacterized membrane protein
MADVPVQFIVAAFQDPNGASAALQQLKEAKKEGVIAIENAAVITKDADGKLRIKETADMGGGKGAAIGGVVGGVIGLIGGPLGIAAGAGVGATIGGLAAKLHDGGFQDARLRQIGDSLKPGTSALVAVIDHTWVLEAERQLQQAGADYVTASISADIAKQLEAGKEVAYSAVGTSEGMAISRSAAGGDEGEVTDVVVTDQGIYADSIERKKDDVSVAAAVVTDQGAVMATGTGKVAAEPATLPADQPKAEAPATPEPAAREDAPPAATEEAKK